MSNTNSLVNIWNPGNYNSEEVPASEVTERMLIRKSKFNDNIATSLAADGIALFGKNPNDYTSSQLTADAVVINAINSSGEFIEEYGSMIIDKNLRVI